MHVSALLVICLISYLWWYYLCSLSFLFPEKRYSWDQCHSENKLNSIRGGLTSVNLHGPGKIQVFVRWAKVNANNLLIFKVQGWGLWVKIILCNQNPIKPLESINQDDDHPLFYTRLPVFPFWFFCTLSKMEMKPRRQSGDRLWSCETSRERELRGMWWQLLCFRHRTFTIKYIINQNPFSTRTKLCHFSYFIFSQNFKSQRISSHGC